VLSTLDTGWVWPIAARTHKARFLGYDICTRQADTWYTKGGG